MGAQCRSRPRLFGMGRRLRYEFTVTEAADRHSHAHSMDGHVLGQIGLHWPEEGDPCGEGLHLHISPLLLEPDGHIDFGVLGVFLDMAGSQASQSRPFVHADISIQRIARPRGEKVFINARALARRASARRSSRSRRSTSSAPASPTAPSRSPTARSTESTRRPRPGVRPRSAGSSGRRSTGSASSPDGCTTSSG